MCIIFIECRREEKPRGIVHAGLIKTNYMKEQERERIIRVKIALALSLSLSLSLTHSVSNPGWYTLYYTFRYITREGI